MSVAQAKKQQLPTKNQRQRHKAMKKELTLADLAALTSSEVIGNPHHVINGVNDLEAASSSEVSFCENPRYEKIHETSHAGAIFISPNVVRCQDKNYLIHPTPSLAFQKAIAFFIPAIKSGFSGIHPSAIIHTDATIGENVTIGPQVVIDAHVHIGSATVIEAGCYIGPKTTIGQNCHIRARATIAENCQIGNRVIIQSGAVIGSNGFGYHTDSKGKHHYLEQLGKVIIEDDVEIGANTTIDRSRFKHTLIGKGTKVDNLVQIAHSVEIGPDCLIVSQVGIAGSTKIGSNCILAGQVGVVGHITLASQVVLTARSAASKSITKAGIYSGAPAMPMKEYQEMMAMTRNIKRLSDKIKKLEDKAPESTSGFAE